MLLKVKQLFWITFILVDLCIFAAALAGVGYLESDEPRLELEKYLSSKLGREVVFEDNFDLIFYPWLGIDTGPLLIGASPEAGYTHQLTVQDIDFKVRLLPLLQGILEVDTVIVDSPVLRIDRDKDGQFDLPVIGEKGDSELSDPESRIFKSISVRGVSVLNATCTYLDEVTGNSFKVSGVKVRTGVLRKDTPLAFDLSADLDTDLFDLQAKTSIRGLLEFSRRQRTVSLSETSVSLSVESRELLGDNESVEAIASLDFDLVEGLIDVKGLVVQGAGLRLNGAARCENIYHSPEFKGNLSATEFDPKTVFSKFTPRPVSSEFNDILNTASFSVDFNSTLEETVLSNMVLAVDDTVVKGDFLLDDYKNPWVEFDIQADSIVLDPYARLFKPGVNATAVKEKEAIQDLGDKNGGSYITKKEFRNMGIADLVHRIPCKGKLEIGRLVYSGMNLQGTCLTISPGPKVASLSIGKGSYLDGDFSLKADLAFNSKNPDSSNSEDILYLYGNGAVSPFSLTKLPKQIEGIKFRSGKAALELHSLNSQGRTLVELVRNMRLNLDLRGNDIAASLSKKDIPAGYRNFHAEKVQFRLTASPLEEIALDGLFGRKVGVRMSADFLKPALNLSCDFGGNIFGDRRSPDRLQVKKSRLDFSIGGQGLPLLKKEVRLTLAGEGKLKNRSLKFDEFLLKSGEITIQGNLDARMLGTDTAAASGDLKLGNTTCADIFNLFGVEKPETRDADAFNSVELDSSFQLNGENLNLRINKCRLDNATAEGTFELVDFYDPYLNFIIKGDKVDVDRFLPPDEENNTRDSKESEFEVKLPEWEFPDNILGAINATGKVYCNYFRIFGFGGSGVSADVDMQNSVIDIHNVVANFHKGNLAGDLTLGLQNGTVSLDTDFEGRGFQAGLFFADYAGRDYVNGLTDASLQLKGKSTANIDFTETMTGRLAFKVTDGSYLFAAPASKNEKIKADPKPTDFSIMQGTIEGRNGDFNVKDYLLNTNYLTATATGGFSFPKDSINLRVNADIVKLPNLYLKIVNALLDAFTGVNVHVTGRLYDPKVEVKGLERWSDVLGDVLGIPEQSFMFFSKLIF